MSKASKIILVAVGLAVALLVIAAAALRHFVDVNAYKPRLEAAASQIFGMEVVIGGPLRIGYSPNLFVTLEDLRIRNRGMDVVTAKEATLAIDFLPLLQRQIRIGKITLQHPTISIVRDRDGTFNVENPEAADRALPALDLAGIAVSNATLRYADKETGDGFEAGDCRVDVAHLQLAGGKSSDFMKNLSIAAKVACADIRASDFAASGLAISAAGTAGVFDLDPVTMRVFGGQGSGSVHADFSAAVPRYLARYSLARFRIEEFFKTQAPRKIVEGAMDFSANLSMQGKTVNQMKRTAHGAISLRGGNLTVHGSDLDQEFARFESSQNFNLVDVGAFFFAGPFGVAVTKGYNFATISQGSGGQTRIPTLVSDWKVEHGVAQAQDVAMATTKNRIALHGALDLVNERFDDVTIALIDAQGCATVQQKIRGSFDKPVTEKPNVLRSLAGPAIKLIKQARDLFPGGKCDVFYAGSVAAPK